MKPGYIQLKLTHFLINMNYLFHGSLFITHHVTWVTQRFLVI